MNRRWIFPLASAVALGLIGFSTAYKPATRGPQKVAIADRFAIPVVLPLTGSGSFLGRAEQEALQRFEAQARAGRIPGAMPVKFSFFDDQSSPQVAVQLVNQIMPSNPSVILGSALVGMCKAMAPLVKDGPVLYCLSPGIHPEPGRRVFTSSSSTKDLMAATLAYFRARGLTRIGLITSIDATGQDARRSLPDLIKDSKLTGLTLVDNVFFNPGDISASAQIEHLKARGPDAIVVWSTGAAVGIVLKGLVQAGLDVPVATTDGNMTLAQMKQYSAILPDELLIPSPAWMMTNDPAHPAVVKARRELQAAYPATQRPDFAAVLAWDPALVVASALRPGMTADVLNRKLETLSDFPGTSGTYDMNVTPQRGLDLQSVVVNRWNPATNYWEPVSGPGGTLQTPAGQTSDRRSTTGQPVNGPSANGQPANGQAGNRHA